MAASHSNNSEKKRQENRITLKMHLLTYNSPDIPVGLYQIYQRYLETQLKCDSYLIVECPHRLTINEKVKSFQSDEIDLAFMKTVDYVKLKDRVDSKMELLPVAPVHLHVDTDAIPFYFSHLIIRADQRGRFTRLEQMHGLRFAYTGLTSLSSYVILMKEIKKLGFDENFFGHLEKTETHLESINLVLENVVDAAAVDSTALRLWMNDHLDSKYKLHSLFQWGPLPIQPVVINTRVSANVKKQIIQSLLDMNSHQSWSLQLAKYDVWGFKEIDSLHYQLKPEIMNLISELDVDSRVAYY